MYNSIGMVISDELVASELIKYILQEYSGVEIKILADIGNLHRINNVFQSNCAFVSLEEILETECIIVLTDVGVFVNEFNSYPKKIIDFTGHLKKIDNNGNVHSVLDPISYIINLLFLDIDNISGNIYLPLAVFGKAGIDELISQTKNVFNFINNKKRYLDVNMPFNVIFLDNCRGSVIKNYVAYIRRQIPPSFSLRLIPVMTGIIADFFYSYNNEQYFVFLNTL